MLALNAPLILGSGSATRRQMLRAAGLTFDVVPATIDEAALRHELTSSGGVTPAEIAEALARAKASDVSDRNSGSFVVGSDQVLDCAGEIFAKPRDDDGVRSTLRALSGKTHTLHSAVAIARDGRVLWSVCDAAHLTMRQLSDSVIESYVRLAGRDVRDSVGAYQIEGLGVQLFSSVEGNHFTILGMPLLPLLQALRQFEVSAA